MRDDPPSRFVPNPEDFDFGDSNDAEPEDWPPAKVKPPPRPGKYLVIHEGETPQQMVAEGFEDFDEAVAFAQGRWGRGEYLKLEMPDGTAYDFGGDMRERINLVRMRRGPLNPKQQLVLKKWEKHSGLQKWTESLQYYYGTMPIHIYESLKDEAGRLLLIEAISYGLLEIIDWTDGGPFPDMEWMDKYLEAGKARSI
jgi:hypothetical protein